jgi:hypothetical protein
VLLPIERRDRGRRFAVTGHLHKSKPFTSAGVSIADDLCRHHLSMSTEQLLQFRSFNVIAQIPNIKLFAHCRTPLDGKNSATHMTVLRKPM